MAGLAGLIGKFLGVESAPIKFDRAGANWSVTAAKLVDMAAQPAMGINPNTTEPLHLDNTGHPASDRIALAHALKSHVDALGLEWPQYAHPSRPEFVLTRPDRDRTSGFFIARLRTITS